MPTSLRRHLPVDMICRECGTSYQAPKERVKKGQGTFCTHKCYTEWYRREVSPTHWGYEKGKKYWDGKKWTVHWYDEVGKVHVTSYARWWWETNIGVVRDGFGISLIDGTLVKARCTNCPFV